MTKKRILLHPLVLVSIQEHHQRMNNNRVIGAILGYVNKTELHITNCFALPFNEEKNWLLDTSYLQNMYDLLLKVNNKEKLLGWYHSGGKLYSNDLSMTKMFSNLLTHPFLVIVNVNCKSTEIPVQLYQLKDQQFKSHSFAIEAEEAEEIGVEYMIRGLRDETKGEGFNRIIEIRNSFEQYKTNIYEIIQIIKKIRSGEMKVNVNLIRGFQKILNELENVNVDTKREEMVRYVTTLVRTVIKMEDMMRNKKING